MGAWWGTAASKWWHTAGTDAGATTGATLWSMVTGYGCVGGVPPASAVYVAQVSGSGCAECGVYGTSRLGAVPPPALMPLLGLNIRGEEGAGAE